MGSSAKKEEAAALTARVVAVGSSLSQTHEQVAVLFRRHGSGSGATSKGLWWQLPNLGTSNPIGTTSNKTKTSLPCLHVMCSAKRD